MSTCQIDEDMTVVPSRVWPLSSVMPALAPLPTAPACARAFVTMTLSLWDMASLADPAGLVVSELVTNAVHASAPYRRDARTCVIGVRLSADRTQILIEVHDEAAGVPRLRTPGELEEGGRGLTLVDAIAGRWGWSPTAGRRGKCVWAELPRLIPACKQ
jgi:hypothetical protein